MYYIQQTETNNEIMDWEECPTPGCDGSSGYIKKLVNNIWTKIKYVHCDKCYR
jgi:hypothetical protein